MIDFYFLSNNMLLILFVVASPILALQSAHAWIIAYNNFKKRWLEFISEFLLMLYILLLARLPIFVMVNRHTSIVYVDSGTMFVEVR